MKLMKTDLGIPYNPINSSTLGESILLGSKFFPEVDDEFVCPYPISDFFLFVVIGKIFVPLANFPFFSQTSR